MNDSVKKILVIDDDQKLRNLVINYLGKEGYEVDGVADGRALDKYLLTDSADLLVLDLMLPGEDGLSIARRLRKSTDIPIIILSARGDEVDRIVGLEVGADDYLAKPFNPRELLARIRAIFRRTSSEQGLQNDSTRSGTRLHHFGPFTIDLLSNALMRDNEVVSITPGDFTLLEIFISHPNRILSRDMLIEQLKGYERSPYDRSIDVRITRLRKKIENNPDHPEFIRTIWGKGYMFTPQGNPEI
jgi:DNA-binding response OmpR family regulator